MDRVSERNQEAPRYRVVLPPGQQPLGDRQTRSALAPKGDVAFINSTPYYVGSEIAFDGWPVPGLEPVNAGARACMRYADKSIFPHRPPTPRSHGQWYVPSHLKADYFADGRWPAPAADGDGAPEMPRYRLKYEARLGSRDYPAGSEIAYLFWPADAFEAINESAKLVAEYFATHAANPNLPDAPWNAFNGTLWLPPIDLAPIRHDRPNLGFGASHHPAIVNARRGYDPFNDGRMAEQIIRSAKF